MVRVRACILQIKRLVNTCLKVALVDHQSPKAGPVSIHLPSSGGLQGSSLNKFVNTSW